MGLDSGLLDAVASLSVQERRLEAVTANLANVSTTAYKRRQAAVSSFQANLKSERELPRTRTVIDHSQGSLESTGNPFDLAINGAGYFAIEGAAGERYTRDGSFTVDPAGSLVNSEGLPVAWVNARGFIDPTGEPVLIDGRANVVQGGRRIGQLKVVEFADTTVMEVNGPGMFSAAGVLPQPATGEVLQGTLEGSNTSSMDELVELVTIQRQYQAAVRLLQTIDRSFQRLNQAR